VPVAVCFGYSYLTLVSFSIFFHYLESCVLEKGQLTAVDGFLAT
jgi:hypothetical protein